MNRAALAVILLAASSGVAAAGTYLGVGIGTGPAIDVEGREAESIGRSGRLLIGSGLGKLAIEGAVSGYDLQFTGGGPADVYQGSVAAKLNLPLGDGFEAFGRFGLQRTWLKPTDERYDVSGNGYLLGAGIEYKFGLGSIFMDYQYANADLEGDRGQYELSSRMWTVGLTIGI